MADEPISALTLLTSYSTADEIEILDVSDTTFASTGTNKRIQFSALLSMAGVAMTNSATCSELTCSQPAEGTVVSLCQAQPYAPGNEAWQIQMWTMPNPSPPEGGAIYDNVVTLGWNAGYFSHGPSTAGKPSLYMGFEDGYYDNGGDNAYGVEWYVGYCTPDGTTIPPASLRPFMFRLTPSDTNTTDKNVSVNCDIGSGPNGRFTVFGSIISGNVIFTVNQTNCTCGVPIIAMAGVPEAITINRGGTGAGNGNSWGMQIQNAGSSDDLTIGWSSTAYTTGGILGWVGNNQGFIYTPSTLVIGTGVSSSGGIAKFSSAGFEVLSSKLGFYSTTPVVQPTAAAATTGYTAGTSTPVTIDGTFTGGTGSTAYTIADLVHALKTLGLIAS